MAYRITFAAGVAVGYVLGARAGRERYEEIMKAAREFTQNPAVRNAAEAAALNGRKAAGKAMDSVGQRLPDSMSSRLDAVRHRVDGAAGRRSEQAEDDDWGTTNT